MSTVTRIEYRVIGQFKLKRSEQWEMFASASIQKFADAEIERDIRLDTTFGMYDWRRLKIQQRSVITTEWSEAG
jgi:hypothetical protein